MKYLPPFLMWLLLLFSSCQSEEEWDDRSEPTRTILVYMIADNSLSWDADLNLNQIVEGASKGINHGNLFVYVDQRYKAPVLYKVTKQGKTVFKEYEECNSASKEMLSQICREVFNDRPTSSNGLIMWSHGEGFLYREPSSKSLRSPFSSDAYTEDTIAYNAPWIAPALPPIRTKWIGQDVESGTAAPTSYLNIDDLRAVLQASAPRLDFLLFDACYMASVEVAYQLRDVTSYLMASPCEILAANPPYESYSGYPYQTIIPQLFLPEVDLPQVAATYYNYYNDIGRLEGQVSADRLQSAAVSVIKTSELEALSSTVRAILADTEFVDYYLRLYDVQYFDVMANGRTYHLYYDLLDVMKTVARSDAQLLAFQNQLRHAVTYSIHTPYFLSYNYLTLNRFCGLTTYVPQSHNRLGQYRYNELDWYPASGYAGLPGWTNNP